MMKKIFDMLRHNLFLKLGSLVLAFGIWLMVVNISNPEVTDTVTVTLEVRNAEELTMQELAYTLDAASVRVSYSVRSNDRRMVRNSDFTAYVDMQDYTVTGAVPIYVEMDSSISELISDVSVNPMVVHVTTEELTELCFSIEAVTVGEPARDFYVQSVTIYPTEVTLYGPVSVLESIGDVTLMIDIDKASSDVSGTGGLSFLDADGGTLNLGTEVTYDAEVGYFVSLYTVKTLYLEVSASGEPAENYLVNGVNVSPASVEVYGHPDTLSLYDTITIPPEWVDVSGDSGNVTVSANIASLIPDGLTLTGDGEVQIVAVIGYDVNAVPETPPEIAGPLSEPPGGPPGESGPMPEGPGDEETVSETEPQPETDTAPSEETESEISETWTETEEILSPEGPGDES